jgi:hypothetical protein
MVFLLADGGMLDILPKTSEFHRRRKLPTGVALKLLRLRTGDGKERRLRANHRDRKTTAEIRQWSSLLRSRAVGPASRAGEVETAAYLPDLGSR